MADSEALQVGLIGPANAPPVLSSRRPFETRAIAFETVRGNCCSGPNISDVDVRGPFPDRLVVTLET